MNVELPDGTVITDVPDGTTQTELMSRMAKMKNPPSNLAVLANSMWKGAAAIPDMVLNAPQNLVNLGRAAVGTVANVAGRPDLAPAINPPLDPVRRLAEKVGLINPRIVPQGAFQRGIDVVGQGAVGGALTGGGGLAGTLTGAGVGALSAGAAGTADAMGAPPAVSAIAGMAVPAAAGAIMSRTPKLSPEVQLLNSEGVSLTPGRIKGGAAQRVEDAATSAPIVGDMIRSAQRRSNETFTAAAVNRSLAPIGEKLPAGTTGNAAVEYAYGKLGDAYNNLLPSLKGDLNAGASSSTAVATRSPNAVAPAGAPAQPSFRQDLDAIKVMGQNLPEAQRTQLNAIIDKEVIGQFTPQGLASGETLKNIESLLGTLAKKKLLSDNYHENQLGGALKEIQASMRRMVNEVNPQYQGELAKINEGYANFKKVQNAASYVGSKDGVFSPAQLHRAVRAGDTSKDKARFAEGNAMMQDLSAAGRAVLPSTVPDSGTPYRAAMMYAMTHPINALGFGLPLAAAALPYTRAGNAITQGAMTRNGNPMYGDISRNTSPIVTQAVMNALAQQNQNALSP